MPLSGDARLARLEEEDLVLAEMLVQRDGAAGRDGLGAEHEVLRAAVLRRELQDEFRGGQRIVRARAAHAVLAFVLVQDDDFGVR